MVSSVKETFNIQTSSNSRSGVILGYEPEDTMRSFLFNQNNRHSSSNKSDQIYSLARLPQTEIDKALQYLSSDSESDSSSYTKSTIRGVVENQHAAKPKIKDRETKDEFNREAEEPVCGHQKTFEEILEEKLKQEPVVKTTSRLKPEISSRNTNSSSASSKFTFLRKNQGKSAWSCNLNNKSVSSSQKETLMKQRSQSSCRNTECQSKSNNKSKVTNSKLTKSLDKDAFLSTKSAQKKPNGKSLTKNVHFSNSCDYKDDEKRNSRDAAETKFQLYNANYEEDQESNSHSEDYSAVETCVGKTTGLDIAQIVTSSGTTEGLLQESIDSQVARDRELMEFELLEQMANVSISEDLTLNSSNNTKVITRMGNLFCGTGSSMASTTRNSSTNSIKSMPAPLSVAQSAYNSSRKDMLQYPLSICEEANEEIDSSNNLEVVHHDIEDSSNHQMVSDHSQLSEYYGEDAGDEEETQSKSNALTAEEHIIKDVEDEVTTSLSEYIEPNKYRNLPRKIFKQANDSVSIMPTTSSNMNSSGWVDSASPFYLDGTAVSKPQNNHGLSLSHQYNNWTLAADPFHCEANEEEEEEEEDHDEEKKVEYDSNGIIQLQNNDNNTNHTSKPLYPIINDNSLPPSESSANQSAKLKQWVQLLEKEINRFNKENEEIAKLKQEKEEGLKRLEIEITKFKKVKDEEIQRFEEYKQMEMKKLKKERKVFDEYQEALKNMPNKKDRQEIESLNAELNCLREEMSNKETRWQSSTNRMRQRIDLLERENGEQRDRIHLLEQKRLQLQAQLISSTNQQGKQKLSSTDPANSKTKPTVTSVSQAISYTKANVPLVGSTHDNHNVPVVASSTSLPSNRNNSNNNIACANLANSFGYKALNPPLCQTVPTQSVKKSMSRSNSLSKSTTNKPPVKPPNKANQSDQAAVRTSAASDYYTGEEEGYGGSQEIQQHKSVNHEIPQQQFPQNYKTQAPATSRFQPIVQINRTTDHIQEELKHPDGIIERKFINGGVDIIYPNGSIKKVSNDTKSIIVYLFNGDVKQVLPDGRIIYYYAQDDSTQTTYADGTEQIDYRDGHKEITHTSGVREIHFPDDSIKIIHPDGTEESITNNGLVVKSFPNGDKEIAMPNGQKEIHCNGVKKRVYPDGTTKTVYPDGRQETCYSSGRYRVKDKAGNLLVDKYVQPNIPNPS